MSEGTPGAGDAADTMPEGRADQVLVARGLARSRAIAQEYISAGRVRRGDAPVRKASERVGPAEVLDVDGEPEPWVGRAAYKLLAALDAFGDGGLGVDGRRCLDVGASTGGFTQVLLSRGAAHVTALDVGHGQLAEEVRRAARVEERSGTSIRDVTVTDLGGTFDVIVGDLSFISLRMVVGQFPALLAEDGDVVLLVKPQFEVGRDALGKTGVVRSAQQRIAAVEGVIRAAQECGLHTHGLVPSPMTGTSGNQEYLLWCRRTAAGMMSTMDVTEVLERTPR